MEKIVVVPAFLEFTLHLLIQLFHGQGCFPNHHNSAKGLHGSTAYNSEESLQNGHQGLSIIW